MKITRVLIVDDIPAVREDLRTLLGLAGDIEIVGEAVNGQDAVRQAATIRPEVILMDLEMPVMDGYEATRQIKSQLPCKVIVLTVHDYESARLKAYEAGVDAFLVKGASVESIVQTLSKHME